jgi:hypothetical protein
MRRFLFLSVFILIYCMGCKKEETPSGPGVLVPSQWMDLSLGKSWEYSWSYVTMSYSGEVLNSYTDTIIVRIVSTTDSLKNYGNLIRFESFSKRYPSDIEKTWYLFDSNSLVEVAYNYVYIGLVNPKYSKRVVADLYKSQMVVPMYPRGIRQLLKAKGVSDTIVFRDDIRIVYKFPLVRGNKWTSFTYPFLETREVMGEEVVNSSHRNYFCKKVSTWLTFFGSTDYWNDYVSNSGLIKRVVFIDSLTITSSDNPDGTGEYAKVIEKLELMN